jgi:dTDP-N-acetylfucosamine:lipid II N-acetylfucosaminyltransferase
MNLHIVPDNVFVNKFYENLVELGISDRNRVVVRSNSRNLKYIRHDLPFAPLYSTAFRALTGETHTYRGVFIHQYTPLLYKWVATNDFNELNWMIWGADLYNLPDLQSGLYERLTLTRYVHQKFSLHDFLYRSKVFLLHDRYKKGAYAKVTHVLTWMTSEFNFAIEHVPGLRAAHHHFFFYENDVPYKAMDEIPYADNARSLRETPAYILGNSSTPELNHLDAVKWMDSSGVEADLLVPVSYGDTNYRRFLKKNLSFYRGGELRFVENYMTFQDYLQFLNAADGLIMNNIRPQGYGNIFMMMYMGKKIFLNERNLSISDLNQHGLIWQPIKELKTTEYLNWKQNRSMVSNLLSHNILLKTYRELFS